MVEKIWISELSQKEIGTKVAISGIVLDKHKISRDKIGIKIKDLSGTVGVSVCLTDTITQGLFWKNTQLQLTGVISLNNYGNKYLSEIDTVLVFGKSENNDTVLPQFDSEVGKKASIMLMSKICRSVSNYFIEHNFIEFESRVISSDWQLDGLESLKVLYPGFGSPATLITSPSPQIIDFMKVAMLARAFTVSSSFATTYRFKDGAAETRVIMSKCLDFTEERLKRTLYDIAIRIVREFGNLDFDIPAYTSCLFTCTWPDYDATKIVHAINCLSFSANLDASTDSYYSKLERIIHIIDREGNILAEGAFEKLQSNLTVSTMTIYPSQFLSLLKKAPSRQLQDLWRKNGWR